MNLPLTTPTLNPAVVKAAGELHTLLQGETDFPTVEWALREWALARGMRNPRNGSARWRVWLGGNVVAKANYILGTVDDIPPQFRPEQLVVWKGRGPRHSEPGASMGEVQVVVQPRYLTYADNLDNKQYDTFKHLTHVACDAHPGNWGLRPDGSPVLFDW